MKKGRVVFKKYFGVHLNLVFILLLLCCFSSSKLEAAGGVVGTHAIYDTEVNIPAGDHVNLNWYRDGIAIGGDATFSNPFPIGSRGDGTTGIDLLTNTLTMSSDLYLGSNVRLVGSIGNSITFAGNSLILTGKLYVGTVGAHVNFDDAAIIEGNGNEIYFGSAGFAGDFSKTIRNAVLTNVSDKITGGTLTLENVCLKDGITLPGATTITTPLPVGGNLSLNSQTLTLGEDLYLGDGVSVVGAGNIDGNEHAIICDGNVQLSGGTVTVADNLEIDGGGNFLDFNGQVLAIDNAVSCTLSNIVLRNVTSGSITLGNANSVLVLDNVVIELVGNLSLGTGKYINKGVVIVNGKGKTLTLASPGNWYLDNNALLYFDLGTTLVANSVTFKGEPTSMIHFNGCTINEIGRYPIPGILSESPIGTVLFENKVSIVGSSDVGNATDVKVLSGARIELDDGVTLTV